MEKMDKKRSFGIVYGDPKIGYEQSGRFFRHDGTALQSDEPEKAEPNRSERMKQAWADKKAREASQPVDA